MGITAFGWLGAITVFFGDYNIYYMPDNSIRDCFIKTKEARPVPKNNF